MLMYPTRSFRRLFAARFRRCVATLRIGGRCKVLIYLPANFNFGPYEPGGRGFESCRARQKRQGLAVTAGLFHLAGCSRLRQEPAPGLENFTDVSIDAAGNAWCANNWNDVPIERSGLTTQPAPLGRRDRGQCHLWRCRAGAAAAYRQGSVR